MARLDGDGAAGEGPTVPEGRKARSLDVARRAGVSRTTVSYVLNGRQDVSIPEETRLKVQRAAAELGYHPNLAARALVSGRTDLVSFWTIASAVRVESGVVQLFGQLCAEDGREMIVARSDVAPRPGELPRIVGDWPVDGILAYNVFGHGVERPEGIPLVSCGAYVAETGDAVQIDLEVGAREATLHLAAAGRRIVFLTNEWGARPDRPRMRGYADAMVKLGLVPETWVVGGAGKRDGYLGTARHLDERGVPDAIFAFSDEIAIGALRALKESGVRVPEECALVGCDGIDDLEYLDPPVSTIVAPYEAMTRLAYELLKSRIERPDRPAERHTLTPRLALRASSARG